MRAFAWPLGLLLVIALVHAAPGNLAGGDRRSFNYRTVDRDAYGSGDILEVANRLREEFNEAAGTNYRSGSYSGKVQGSCPGCSTSVSSRVSHSSNFGRQKSQEELDAIARDLADRMLDDVRDGRLQQSQISASPNYFEQEAQKALESMGMRQSQSQSQFSTSGRSYQSQQQQQHQSQAFDRDVENIDTQQRQRPVFEDSFYTQSTHTNRGSVRPIVSNSQHSIYDHFYEEHVPNYQSRVVYPDGYEHNAAVGINDLQRPSNPIFIRPGTGSVRVNFTLSTYNKTSGSSHPGQGQTHVVTFNRNFTEADKREQIQSIIEEITNLNRTQLHGMDDIISQLVIQLDENSTSRDKQNVQDEIFKLIENIRNQYGAWNYPSQQSQGRVTEEDLLYKEVQELVQSFGSLMKNQTQSFSATNSLSTFIKSTQQSWTYEEKQTQAIVIQQEIRRLTEEIRIWQQAHHVAEQERQGQINLLQHEIRELQTILRQWNVPVSNTNNSEQISTHIIQIQNQLSNEEKQKQSSLIQTEIERLRQEMERWQQQTQINEQQRQQQVGGIWSEISSLSQIIEEWKRQQSQVVMQPQQQLSTHIITIENQLTDAEKDQQTQVMQEEIQRLRQEMERYSHNANVNDQRGQSQIVNCRQEISKLTEIIQDWRDSKPTITPENQLSTHIIQIESNLSETDKSHQTQLINTEIERLRQELERWKHLQHVNENKRQQQIQLIHTEMEKLTEIIQEWRDFKPAITPQNQLSTHIIHIESSLTENEKEQQEPIINQEIQRLREELEKWKHTQNVATDKRDQQVQMIRQEITQLTEIIQNWKDTKPTIVPGNQMSQHIITIEKTFSEEDRNRQNAVVQNEINRLREELQRWSHLQTDNEQKRAEQVQLIKSEISKLTEIVEEWREVSKPVIEQSKKLSTHYITIESSLTENERVQQSHVIEQEIARLRDEMEKWRRLQHVSEHTKQDQIIEIRQEISKLTEIIQDWREHKPTLVPNDLLSMHVIQIEHNLSDTDKEHQTILIREEIDRLRQELQRWTNMHQVNEQKRQQQIQLINSEITKLTTIIEEWKETKSTLTPQNQLSVQIVTQESHYTEEEKVAKTAQIESEIERLREEMHRWSQMQNVNEQKRQHQVQMIRTEITKLTKIVDDWRQSRNMLVPEKQMSLHIISIESTLTESDKIRQIPQIRQEIQRLEQELEKWNSIQHVSNEMKQQQVMVIWEEITTLRRIMDDFSRVQSQNTGDGTLMSSHMISIEKGLTEEEKLIQTVIIKEEISRLRTDLDRWMKDTTNTNRHREIMWIRKEIEKLNEILRNWKLTESPTNKGHLSAHILSIEHTLSDDQKLKQTIIIKEEITRLQQEQTKWQQHRGDRREKEENIFFIRQEINKLNQILAGWKAQDQIGVGGQMSSYILSIQHSLSSDQKEIEAVKMREEIRRLEQDMQRWTSMNRNQAEKQRQLTIIRNEITMLTQILEDWELEKMSPDFSKLSTHLLHIDQSLTEVDVQRNEELILKEIHRLNVVMEEWRTRKNVNEEERHKVIMLIQKEIDLLQNILKEWKRRVQEFGLLSVFIRSIEQQLNEEGRYYYSLLIIQDIVRLQRESARWRAANENQEMQCWYIQEKNNNISFDQEKNRQLKMIREEIERLVQILKEWQWRKVSNNRWIHKVYTPDYTATTKHPGVFIYDKNGTTTGITRPVGKLIDRTRGDQPPHHFEEDYISEEIESEPGIDVYQPRPAPIIISTTMRPRPTVPQIPPQQTVEVFPTQREYRRREYQKTTITTNTGVMPQFQMSASASAGAGSNTQQRQIPIWASQATLADADPTLSGLESMSHTRPHDVQQTQPIFNEDDHQQSYIPFEDPMQKHVKEAEKDVVVQKTKSPKDMPQAHVNQEEKDPKEGDEKPGFWQKFGDKAKGIFG